MAEKSWNEIKADILQRAGRINPFERVRKTDVEQIVESITSLDPDVWGKEWAKFGAKYETLAEELEKQGKRRAAGENFYLAYEYYRVGRYPVPSSPEKMSCYRGALRTFLKAAPSMDPPLERCEIPFAGKTVVGYLQVPSGSNRTPVIMHWGGVDGWKEDRRSNSEVLLRAGMASFTIDMPGTGENPCLAQEAKAERTFSAAVDYLEGRPDLDGKRIGCMGGSFGGYWAAKLAHTEAKRLRGAVNWGAGVHRTYVDGFPISHGPGESVGRPLVHFSGENVGRSAWNRAEPVAGNTGLDRRTVRPAAVHQRQKR
jgi:esterase FrsA